jgi:antitoxin VapB
MYKMAIHVQDEETDWLVRDFARRRGVGITAAIKLAVQEATEKELSAGDALARKIEPIVSRLRAIKKPEVQDDKEFMDEMWGEPK